MLFNHYAAGAAIRIRCKPCIGFLAAHCQLVVLGGYSLPSGKELRCWCSYLLFRSFYSKEPSVMEPVAQCLLRCANAPYAASKQAAISCISITKPSGAICNELHHASASLIIINRRA